MLHPHPKFVHLCEVLEYKLDRIHDSVGVPARDKATITSERAQQEEYDQIRVSSLQYQAEA